MNFILLVFYLVYQFSTIHYPETLISFFQTTIVPDTKITDNEMAAYYMIGGSNAAMNELIESQYR